MSKCPICQAEENQCLSNVHSKVLQEMLDSLSNHQLYILYDAFDSRTDELEEMLAPRAVEAYPDMFASDYD